MYVDGDNTLQFSAKAQSRTSIRLQDSEGFTEPQNISVGNLVQWRNIAYLEVNHDLWKIMEEVSFFRPLKRAGIEAKYRLVGRIIYEAIYNIGPQGFQDIRDRDKENVDEFKQQYDLWEGYIDLSRGPLFFRLGRQNLAWGETDIFRLLDQINPLDNTFGGIFEDLDDRRIPLWMLRGSVNLGTVGPLDSLSLEGFWVPGTWDAHVSPWPPFGTAYYPPLGALPPPLQQRIVYPDRTVSSSRWGTRLMGVLLGVNCSVAHYKTFTDLPQPVFVIDPDPVPFGSPFQELRFDDIQITGAAFNFWQPTVDAVFRAELAWFWEEAVFIPEINIPLAPPPIPIPGVPVVPQNGQIPDKDFLRFMAGIDKQLWVRSLNRKQMFFFSLQYFGQWAPEFDERMRQGIPIPPAGADFVPVKEIESTLTALVNNNWMDGRLTPQLALAYDVRGAWLIQPSVNFIREPFRFMLQYSGIQGALTGFGAFRDRDQVSLSVTYLLN